jgi:ABC-type polysaccharide transport system permease subunit
MAKNRMIPPAAGLRKQLYRQKHLQLMTLPGLMFLIIFCCFPGFSESGFRNEVLCRSGILKAPIGFGVSQSPKTKKG